MKLYVSCKKKNSIRERGVTRIIHTNWFRGTDITYSNRISQVSLAISFKFKWSGTCGRLSNIVEFHDGYCYRPSCRDYMSIIPIS
jgi:hypothetical protein